MMQNRKLTRIGVFYDGNYFYHVSNYYNYHHDRKSRISIKGLHDFIRHKVAEFELDHLGGFRHCQIVDAHYFRGRMSAKEALEKTNLLYFDRVFDDILMSEGVTTHYLPVKVNNGKKEEKGIDVWLALEALETTYHKRFDVVVLVACDGDFVPLIRKLNSLGTKVMLLSWDFEYTDELNVRKTTRTAQDLLETVTYPVAMHELINNRLLQDNYIINNLFIPKNIFPSDFPTPQPQAPVKPKNEFTYPEGAFVEESKVLSLHNGYGFIEKHPFNLYFHHSQLRNISFYDLKLGDKVKYLPSKNEDGGDIALDIVVIESEESENNNNNQIQ
ncbi:NYN domain-containing protein [bacterium]|nr:NYN domain-containing protein [bacterium]